MMNTPFIRQQIRELVDPLILKLRQELFGSGRAFGTIATTALPPTVVVINNGGGGSDQLDDAGYIKGVSTFDGGVSAGTEQTELDFYGFQIEVDGARTVITNELADGSVTSPKIEDGAVTLSKLAEGSATEGQVILFSGGAWTYGTVALDAGSSTFLDLTDTPNDYTGQDGKLVIVSSGALVFTTLPSHTHPLSALTQSAASSGQVPVWDGSAWVPGTVTAEGISGSVVVNPMTAEGDYIIGSASSTVDEAAGKTTTASSLYESGSIARMVDGNDSTYIFGNTSAASGTQWFYVDLLTAKLINGVRIVQRSDSSQYRATTILLQTSSDASSWTTVQTVNVLSATIDTGIIPLDTPATARYWRIFATAGGSFGWCVSTLNLYSGILPGTPQRAAGGGTTANRPSSPVLYQHYYDTTISGMIVWNGSAWNAVASGGSPSIPLTTRGDLLTRDASNNVRLPIGSGGTYLRSDGIDSTWSVIDQVDLPVEAVRRQLLYASTGDVAIWHDPNHIRYITGFSYDTANAVLSVPRLRLPEASAPSTPPAGSTDLYVDTNGVPSSKDDAGVVRAMIPTASAATLYGLNIGGATGAASGEFLGVGSSTGTIRAEIRNTNSAATAYAFMRVSNDASTDAGLLRMSSGNTGYVGANGLMLFTTSAHPIGIATNNTVRMTVTSTGTISMGGATSSAVRLLVYGLSSAAGTYSFNAKNSSGTNIMYLGDDGSAYIYSAWSVSDAREKHNIRAINASDRARARAVQFTRFTRNLGDIDEFGVIAQDVQAVAPEFVREGMDGVLAVNMISLLSAKVAALEDEIDNLKRRGP